jgi:hypothetical protein
MRALSLAAAALALAACYDPAIPNGAQACASGGRCADGYQCGPDNRCYLVGQVPGDGGPGGDASARDLAVGGDLAGADLAGADLAVADLAVGDLAGVDLRTVDQATQPDLAQPGCLLDTDCTGGRSCCSKVCVDEKSDRANCGACGKVCTLANATAACTNAACTIASCNAGFGDCNLMPADGCELPLGGDPKNCGMCGHSCNGLSCVASACVPNKRAFVSSVLFTGNMGGLVGADGNCQSLANAVQLGGVWKAWLSDDTGANPGLRMTHFSGGYALVDGVTLVANGWSGLTSGSLLHPINLTEKRGAPPIGNTSCGTGNAPTVWTDTSPLGVEQFPGDSCSSWTSTTGGSEWGNANDPAAWTSWCNGGSCAWLSAIYCIEQ